jgi:hypothetical protein
MRGVTASWAGWFDLFLMSNLNLFDGYNTQSDQSVRHTSLLTIDACGHCVEAGDYFEQNAIQGRTMLVLGQLFETYGVWDGADRLGQIKNISFYVMSSNDTAGKDVGQYWTSIEKFPVPMMTDYYFHGDGSAQLAPPSTDDSTSSSTYVYDPSNPVPTLGGNNLPKDIGGTIPCGPWDQASLSNRTDILRFSTPVQANGTELVLTGPMFAKLFVSSDAIDTDFMVKISDLYYDTGEVRIIMDNALRMRWRDGNTNPNPIVSGQVL